MNIKKLCLPNTSAASHVSAYIYVATFRVSVVWDVEVDQCAGLALRLRLGLWNAMLFSGRTGENDVILLLPGNTDDMSCVQDSFVMHLIV